MKKIGLLGLLLISAMQLMAQDVSRKDSLLNALKTFRFPNQKFQIPNSFKLNPKDSLLGKMYNFKYPGADSLLSQKNKPLLKNGIYHSPIDHMPIANLPSNSRMPVYKLPRSTDKMPGSNLPVPATVVPVAPQK